MNQTPVCTAADAIYRLAAGNLKYLNAESGNGDISRRVRLATWAKGQSPYAIIVTCSDSRVIPESIFSAGIGELFVIRLAGNVIDDQQLGSIEYAAGHLGCRLVVVLGHTTAARWMPPSTTSRRGISSTSPMRSKKPLAMKKTPIRPAAGTCGTVCRRSRRACASTTWKRKPACGSSVRCITSRTAVWNSCKI